MGTNISTTVNWPRVARCTMNRRKFLAWAGAGTLGLISGCSKDSPQQPTTSVTPTISTNQQTPTSTSRATTEELEPNAKIVNMTSTHSEYDFDEPIVLSLDASVTPKDSIYDARIQIQVINESNEVMSSQNITKEGSKTGPEANFQSKVEIETEGWPGGNYTVKALLFNQKWQSKSPTKSLQVNVGHGEVRKRVEVDQLLDNARSQLKEAANTYRKSVGLNQEVMDVTADLNGFDMTEVLQATRDAKDPIDEAEALGVEEKADAVEAVRAEYNLFREITRAQYEIIDLRRKLDEAWNEADNVDPDAHSVQGMVDRSRINDYRSQFSNRIGRIQDRIDVGSKLLEKVGDDSDVFPYESKLDQLESESNGLDNGDRKIGDYFDLLNKFSDANSDVSQENYDTADLQYGNLVDDFPALAEEIRALEPGHLSDVFGSYAKVPSNRVDDVEEKRKEAAEKADEQQ